MRQYGKIETGLWQNRKVRGLSDDAKMTFIYLCACPHGNSIGCFVLLSGYIEADLSWPEDKVRELLSILVSKGFIERNYDSGLTRICGWFGHNVIHNDKHAKGVMDILQNLPQCAVFFNLINDLQSLNNKHMDKYLTGLDTGIETSVDTKNRNTNKTGSATQQQQSNGQPRSVPPVELKPEARNSSSHVVVGMKILKFMGCEDNPNLMGNFGMISPWLEAGADPELDIYPAVDRVMNQRRSKGLESPGSINYFEKPILQAMSDRKRKVSSETPPSEERNPKVWANRLRVFSEQTLWNSTWGPKPDEEGCLVPTKILSKFTPIKDVA